MFSQLLTVSRTPLWEPCSSKWTTPQPMQPTQSLETPSQQPTLRPTDTPETTPSLNTGCRGEPIPTTIPRPDVEGIRSEISQWPPWKEETAMDSFSAEPLWTQPTQPMITLSGIRI